MNFQDGEDPEGSIRIDEDPQPSSSSDATTPTNANAPPLPPASQMSRLPNHRPCRMPRRRGRAAIARHSEALPAPNRPVSLAVREALATHVSEGHSSAIVSAKISNRAALVAKQKAERRYLRHGGDNMTRVQQDRKQAKWMNGQGRIGHAFQRSNFREA